MEKLSAPPAQALVDRASPLPEEFGERARFDALRRQTFLEMGRHAAKWRLMWIVPFQALVLGMMILRGMSTTRIGVQVAVVVVSSVLFKIQMRNRGFLCSTGFHLTAGATVLFVSVANTGGLASPLLFTAAPILVGASVAPIDLVTRIRFFLFFGFGCVAIALLSRTPTGILPAPLAPNGIYSSAEYVTMATAAMVFTAGSVFVLGEKLTRVYSKIAFELAARREQLCSEEEDRTRALEGIAARLAHEVKNPLAAIKGLSVHMASSASDPKTAERLAIVAAEADRLQSIVDGVLSFSRGLEVLQLAPTKPYAIAREIATLLEARAIESGVTLTVEGDPSLGLNADARKLRQALLNLVLNAMQASPAGSNVTIDVGGSLCGARVRVIDHGPGMSREVLERIKKPYFTTRDGGTGLGIAVARGLVEQHGGTLTYESELGRGTTAEMELPMCASDASKKEVKLPNLGRAQVRCQAMAKDLEAALTKARKS